MPILAEAPLPVPFSETQGVRVRHSMSRPVHESFPVLRSTTAEKEKPNTTQDKREGIRAAKEVRTNVQTYKRTHVGSESIKHDLASLFALPLAFRCLDDCPWTASVGNTCRIKTN